MSSTLTSPIHVFTPGEHTIMDAIREGRATYYSLLTTHCLLLATCYLLLATCYLPLTTCYLLPGEHKIMDAIREGRASGAMEESTRHCM